jgi:hypothetical protein
MNIIPNTKDDFFQKNNNLHMLDNLTYRKLTSLNRLSLLVSQKSTNIESIDYDTIYEPIIDSEQSEQPEQIIDFEQITNYEKSTIRSESKIKQNVKFSKQLENIIYIPNYLDNLTLNYQNFTYKKFIEKYSNKIIKLNIILKIPYDVINKKNIDMFFFKISNITNSIYTNIEPSEKYDIYSEYEYDVFELENINVYLDKKDTLELKISYVKYNNDSDNQTNQTNKITDDNMNFDQICKKRILTRINLDYQEMLENYEDDKKNVKFKDINSGIIIKYNLVIYQEL